MSNSTQITSSATNNSFVTPYVHDCEAANVKNAPFWNQKSTNKEFAGQSSYQPPNGYYGVTIINYDYKHGTGNYVPAQYKHTLSLACCCQYMIDCLAIFLVIAFMLCAGWVCYYALNNGGG